MDLNLLREHLEESKGQNDPIDWGIAANIKEMHISALSLKYDVFFRLDEVLQRLFRKKERRLQHLHWLEIHIRNHFTVEEETEFRRLRAMCQENDIQLRYTKWNI